MYEAVAEAVARARAGEGPTLIEAVTYRWNGHSKSDKNLYRTREEIARMAGERPDRRLRGGWSPTADALTRTAQRRRATRRTEAIREAVRFGNAAPPSPTADDAALRRLRPHRTHRVTHDTACRRTGPQHDRHRITYAEAVREAIGQAMAADDRVFMLGEDIGIYGGAFGVSGDLYDRFGADRIRDTPISELGIVGAAVGAALAGMRPIVEIQFSDFTCQAMDQIVNQAAKIHFMLGGAAERAAGAARARRAPGTGAAAQHSQSPRGLVRPRPRAEGGHAGHRRPTPRACCCPPSTTPTRSSCWSTSCSTAQRRGARRGRPLPLGKAAVAPRGDDLTIVATGIMVQRSLEAAEALAAAGHRAPP